MALRMRGGKYLMAWRAAAAAIALLVATLVGMAASPARANVAIAPCREVGLSVSDGRELWECRSGSGTVDTGNSGDELFIEFASGLGLDISTSALFRLVRIDVARDVPLSDIAIADFAEDYLFDGSPEVTPEEGFAEFELAMVTHPIAGETPSHCYVFLRQWFYGHRAEYKHRFGGYYCGIIAMPDRRAVEEFLSATHYEAE